MADHLYPPVRRCIYCGETKLPASEGRFTDEHVIPLALGGNLVLQEASCKRCAKIINREIETPVLDHEWGNLRAKRDFPTRNKQRRKRKKLAAISVTTTDGSPLSIPLAEHSTPTVMYKFGEARILSGLGPGIDDLRWTPTIITSHDEEVEMQRRFPKWDKLHRLKMQPYPFARLLAKIAHSYVVAEYGIAFTPFVLDIILGRSTDYFLTVGGSWDIQPAVPGGDHVINISMRVMKPAYILILGEIRLFSQIESPSYHVVVGEIDLKNPDHVAAFEKHRLAGKVMITSFKID